MANAAALEPPLLTLADVINHLGGVPAERVRLRPMPGAATERDVVWINDHEDRLCELVDGILLEKTVGLFESRLAVVIAELLSPFVRDHQLGIVVGEAGMMRIAPGLVRIPDVSVILWSRMPGRRVPREPVPDLAPDLAIEILSTGNTKAEMDRKIREYLAAGVRLVWVLDPPSQSMEVYTSPTHRTLIQGNEVIDGGAVLPGFSVRLSEIFRLAEDCPAE